MRFASLAFVGVVAAAPAPQFDLGALLGGLGGKSGGGAGGLDIGALLGGLTGGAGGAGGLGGLLGGLTGGAGGAAPDLGSLIGGFLGGGSGPAGDVSVIINQYTAIQAKVKEMDAYVQTIQPNGTAPADVIEKLNKLSAEQLATVKAGTKAVEGMAGNVDLMNAMSLQAPGGDVTAATQTALENLKKVIPAIAKVPGAKEAQIKNLQALVEATKEFTAAINKRLPSIALAIAEGEGNRAVEYFNDALAAFQKA
jgi:hypothetical protein